MGIIFGFGGKNLGFFLRAHCFVAPNPMGVLGRFWFLGGGVPPFPGGKICILGIWGKGWGCWAQEARERAYKVPL